jgi:hypothetical protein
LSPSDFHLFAKLKEAVGGEFADDDDKVKKVMHNYLHT